MLELSQGNRYPVLPLRDIVVFPHMIVPLFVGREKSVNALEEVKREDKQILLVAQKDAQKEDPQSGDLYDVGTLASILQLLKLPDGTIKVLVEGGQRARVKQFTENDSFLEAEADVIAEDETSEERDLDALRRSVVSQFEQYIKLNKKIPPEVLNTVSQIEEPSKLADTVASHLSLKIADKQELLEADTVAERLEKIYGYIEGEIGGLEAEKRVRNRVKKQMEKTQREYYLNEQLKAIRKELGEGDDGQDELQELEDKLKKAKLPKQVREKADQELKKLKNMSPMSAESTVVRNYLDWIVAVPWKKRSKLKNDLQYAREVLDADHYGLTKVKDRILEYLAVQQRMGKVKGPILCLVGPPGVGKTSLGKSIARATNRQFVRQSLGGVRDEAEMRGHRRTYIGSMPGKVVQGMKKAGTTNPLFLLDEVDKLGADWRGDPTSALLEILDPEQNDKFVDHYLDVEYDLSGVMFITTANTLDMPPALLDRMEIIRIPGYTEDEKVEIAKRHLITKQRTENGLTEQEWSISDTALRALIRRYTREAGVRNLEREIGTLARKAVKEIQLNKATQVHVTKQNLEKYAGVPRFKHTEAETEDLVGVATGMAWTEVGGELLSVESVTVPGKGKVTSTGKLGEVMKESIQASEYFIKARAPEFGIQPNLLDRKSVHVHVPEGGTPKDGPSAGIAMVTSIVSALTGIPVRHDVAMTGEVTLRGRVLAIGGLKEKLLAAMRGGIKTVLIPKQNEKDLADIPNNVKRGLEIVPVDTVDEVLDRALTTKPTPVDVVEETEVDQLARPSEPARGGVTKH
ncbi:endopeptidase La [Rhodovibrio sodomensis]|uniref:Lon protease n=1 Tax=Rhodovibrio sodomensis TaxID=1088 RepID=A0ABS1DDR0_9PROT|nr:endopeptidase La [Rhodovibrio sodomensis]MBK1668593.1 endopeptidase La [Rhodovibrio sodomensis]